MFLWKINPIKKPTLDLLKKTKLINNPKIVADLYLNSKFKVNVEDTSFYLYNDKFDKSSFDIYLDGIEKRWDRTSLKIWKDLSERSETIFDIGTNIGLYCLTAKKSNGSATVIGFEPSNNSFNKMKKNILINDCDILLEKLALSNTKGTATFYDSRNHTAVSSLVLNPNLRNDDLISYEVEVTTFDDYIEANKLNKVDLLSIDVEENVLLGMKKVISRDKPTILIEVLRGELGKEIQTILDQNDYKYYFINEEGFVKPTKDLSARPSNFVHSYNVLAISRKNINDFLISKWVN
jgi:FkbM family methyltransferase